MGPRSIYGATFLVLVLVAALSVLSYRATERDLVGAFANERLAVARTVAVALETEVQALESALRQLRALPSVQLIDTPFVSSRIAMTFDGDTTRIVREIVRVDAERRRSTWTPDGAVVADREPLAIDDAEWARLADPARASTFTITRAWHRPLDDQLRQITLPVRHVSPNDTTPVAPGTFVGVLAFVVDVQQVIRTFARPGDMEALGAVLVLLDGDGEAIVYLNGRPAALPLPVVPAMREQAEGRAVVPGAGGEGVTAAWSAVAASDQTWTVRIDTPLSLVAPGVRTGALRQLWLIGLLMLAVPFVAWVLVRRERRAEEDRLHLQAQLLQAQKMDAIGKLAGGVAHDFNNLLTAIIGYTSLILERSEPASKVHADATQIRRAAESAASLTHKLLAFSRKQVLQPQRIDLGGLVRDLQSLLGRLLGERIRLDVHVEEHTWPVVADPVQIEQVLINLAVNARDAMPAGGTLTLTVRNLALPEGQARRDHHVAPGPYVQIRVRDTGTGMDAATLARLFEPFFTTKPQGQGTGLGLPTVYGILKQSGGYIEVESAPGTGTAVDLLLPAQPDAAPALPRAPRANELPRGTETVLLVEDDAAVLELTEAALSRAGYHVLPAAGPEEAIRMAREHPGPIALLLSDVVMPVMLGPEMAGHIRALRPSIRVLFMSGYAADAGGDLQADAALLQKPFSSAVLVRAVRLVIDAAPTVDPAP
ncbi:MAG: ATP-binding protein [Vicinamibacterales bacterium]|nr:ATP-binding protein [Vicinamibacterales bacterium]